MEEQYGRSPDDDGADEMLHKIRLLRRRVNSILDGRIADGRKVGEFASRSLIADSLVIPDNFLFYKLRWPSPHLGIEVCIRWEKPLLGVDLPSGKRAEE
jgi:hypothetical protein